MRLITTLLVLVCTASPAWADAGLSISQTIYCGDAPLPVQFQIKTDLESVTEYTPFFVWVTDEPFCRYMPSGAQATLFAHGNVGPARETIQFPADFGFALTTHAAFGLDHLCNAVSAPTTFARRICFGFDINNDGGVSAGDPAGHVSYTIFAGATN